MKKLLLIVALLLLAGCNMSNMSIIDTTHHFDHAYITLPDGVVEGDVYKWVDYEDSDMVQVTLTDGRTFYTHGVNIVLTTIREIDDD